MGKVVIYSDLYLTTFPYLEIPLLEELKSLGASVLFVLQAGDYRLITPGLREIFVPITTVIQNPKKELIGLVNKDDVCIMRFGYKGLVGDVAAGLRANKRKILMLDPAAIDIRVRECLAQWITVKSEWMKQQVLKRFPGRYKGIFATGTIHFDPASVASKMNWRKEDFIRSYGLNHNKKLAVLTPANPAELGHQKGVNNEYLQIIQTVQNQCPEYNIMVKGHPMDYTAILPAVPGIIHKNQHYGNKCSWETFAPGVKIVKPEEGYAAFKLADVVLNVRSSIAMETPLFPTPILNINRHKYTTNWPASNNPEVMKDISLNALANTLNTNNYVVDPKACKEYVLKYCDPIGDGCAYKRTAQVALKLL